MPENSEEFDAMFKPGAESEDDGGFSFDPSEAVEFARLVPGTYDAIVAEDFVPERQLSQNGNPMMKVKFFVIDKDFYGATPSRRFMLSGKGGGWTKEFLKAIGLDEEAEGKRNIVPKKLMGRRCVIKCAWQKNQDGTTSDEWVEIVQVKRHPEGPVDGSGVLDVGV